MDIVLVSNLFQLDLCMDIRRRVFIQEQCVPEDEEIDHHDRLDDPIADHFLFMHENQPIGTVRCLKKEDQILKIGRVAVIKEERGKGWGRQMMDLIEKHYSEASCFVLDAQTQAIPFYLKCGYASMGEIFIDAGIEHQHMEKRNTR